MSTIKDFIRSQKLAKLKETLIKGKMPEQGTYITLFNNDYKVLTQPDSKICILEDIKANKVAYPREKLLKMLSKSIENSDLEKASGPRVLSGPNKLVGQIGQNVKPSSTSTPSNTQRGDPIGTIRNGRKKVVSKRTGQTMWVNISTGEAHESHEEDSPKVKAEQEAEQHLKTVFDKLGDKLHPEDKPKLQEQMTKLVDLHQRVRNMLDTAHQDDKGKLSEAALTRNKVFALQDQYQFAKNKFKEALIASIQRRKKEGA